MQQKSIEPGTVGSDIPAIIADLAPWFHNLHLPGGYQTAAGHTLGDFPARKWRFIRDHLPRDLSGWRALDIGCNAGFYSFELARRGALVTAIDTDPHYLRQARWAAELLQLTSMVQFELMSVYGLARQPECYDLVMFTGVFYHLRYPLLALDIAARKTKRLMVFQTLSMPGRAVFATGEDRVLDDRDDLLRPGWPKMAFVENKLAGDPTNWWVANHAGALAMLRSSGLRPIGFPAEEIYLCEPDTRLKWPADFIEQQLSDIFDADVHCR